MFASRAARSFAPRVRHCSSFTCITQETRGAVGLITLNRPKALNALSPTLVRELAESATALDNNPDVGAIVITGSGNKAFAAGADIKEMAGQSYMDMFKTQLFKELDQISTVRKPIIAAVNGFALGGGCELAMCCDIILAADTATFGQPEIKLGTIPGLGGTQRFTRAVGKSRAMELVLTGGNMTAQEALTRGLVARVVPAADLLDDALKTAGKIAKHSQPIVAIAKDCVNRAFESSLTEGLRYERSIFYSTFATQDQKIGMKAFVAKEKADFQHN
jgi:enoyl-CoA hydratase/carnithine racemase